MLLDENGEPMVFKSECSDDQKGKEMSQEGDGRAGRLWRELCLQIQWT
jgi:hypothetical protein